MGWLFNNYPTSKKDFIAQVLRDYNGDNERCSYKVLAKAIKGNCLWMVCEVTPKTADAKTVRYIELCLIDRHDGCWGFKNMDEGMGPYYFSCPLAYLDMAPPPETSSTFNWRERVRAYHAERSAKVEKGKCYKLKNVQPGYDYVKITSVRPLRGYVNGSMYAKIRKVLIGEEIPDPYTIMTVLEA
jgi:hypothetical protein